MGSLGTVFGDKYGIYGFFVPLVVFRGDYVKVAVVITGDTSEKGMLFANSKMFFDFSVFCKIYGNGFFLFCVIKALFRCFRTAKNFNKDTFIIINRKNSDKMVKWKQMPLRFY